MKYVFVARRSGYTPQSKNELIDVAERLEKEARRLHQLALANHALHNGMTELAETQEDSSILWSSVFVSGRAMYEGRRRGISKYSRERRIDRV